MKSFGEYRQELAEAKATYCGRCGTTHVPPAQGGTCPAVKNEEAEQIDEVGDTAKGQKLLQKVNKRAVDRLVSKKADTDPAYARKAMDTHLAADSRLKEEVEMNEVEEGFENLPGKATHLTNKDIRHPEYGIISGSTTLRHLGSNKYEVRAGRAKGKTIALDKQHVQKLSEEAGLDEAYGDRKYRSAAWHADGGANDEGHGNSSRFREVHKVYINGRHWKTFGSHDEAQKAHDAVQRKYPDKSVTKHTTYMESVEQVDEGLSDFVKGVKRKVAGKVDPKEVEHMYGRMARSAINHKTPDQAKRDIERYKKVAKVVNKEELEQVDELNQMTLSRYAAKARVDQSKDRKKGVATANRKLRFGEYSEMVDQQNEKQ